MSECKGVKGLKQLFANSAGSVTTDPAAAAAAAASFAANNTNKSNVSLTQQTKPMFIQSLPTIWKQEIELYPTVFSCLHNMASALMIFFISITALVTVLLTEILMHPIVAVAFSVILALL